MDPQTNQIAQTQTQVSDTAQTTFSAQVAKEDVLGNAAFEKNSSVLTAHRRSSVYRLMWLVLALLLLSAIGFFLYFSLRGGGPAKTVSPASEFNNTRVNLSGFSGGVLTNGQLTVNGDANIVNNLNVGGDANIGGTLTASNIQGNGSGITDLQSGNITGVIGAAQLDPFIAYTNKNFQSFFGTNQSFRNATNSSAGFQVQNASSAPILSVNTESNYVVINESVSSQPGLSFETNGNGRFAGSLQVGLQSNPNTSILHTGNLFNNDLQRVLTVQEEITNNNVPGRIYTGQANELLVNPQFNPDLVVNGGQGNIFAGGYSAIEIAQGNAFNFGIVGGNLNAVTHSGSGNVTVATSNFSTVTNRGPGNIIYGVGNIAAPSLTGTGSIGLFAGFSALDPESPIFSLLGTPNLMTGTGVLAQQVGVLIDPQHSGSLTNYDLAALGLSQTSIVEGKLQIGFCSDVATTTLLYNCGNPAAQGVAPFTPANPVPGGNKLVVNKPFITDANAALQVSSTLTTDKPLVVQGAAGQTGHLTDWQSSTGLAISVVDASGRFGIFNSAPAFDLHVGSAAVASGTTVARFQNAGGTCDVTPNVVGGVTCTSDIRLKKDISDFTDSLSKIGAINIVNYHYTAESSDDPIHVGVLAQELEAVLPDLVRTDAQGIKSVSYAGLTPYLVQAIKQQQAQIDSLKVIPAPTVATVDVLKTLADSQAVVFGGDVTINGSVIIKGALVGNPDTRGSVTIPTGSLQASHSFTSPHSNAPYVVASPVSKSMSYHVQSSASGFTVFIDEPQTENIVFDYLVQQ